MDIKAIKDLAQKYTVQELDAFAQDIENGLRPDSSHFKEDPADLISDFIQAAEVRKLIDNGLSVQEAIREFTKRVRSTLS